MITIGWSGMVSTSVKTSEKVAKGICWPMSEGSHGRKGRG